MTFARCVYRGGRSGGRFSGLLCLKSIKGSAAFLNALAAVEVVVGKPND